MRKTLANCFFGVSGAAAEALFEDLDRGWLEGKVAGVEVGLLDLLDALGWRVSKRT